MNLQSKAFKQIVKQINGKPRISPNTNVLESYVGQFRGLTVLVERFHGDWFTVDMARGEMRELEYNGNPLGQFGLISSYSDYVPNPDETMPGSSIPGHTRCKGLRYRVIGCASRSRTQVISDHYEQPNDLLEYLQNKLSKIAKVSACNGDLAILFKFWDKAKVIK